MLAARYINFSNSDTLAHIGRGIYLLYKKGKYLLIHKGNITMGDIISKVTPPSPITQLVNRRRADIYPFEVRLKTFQVGFEQRLGIKTSELRKETYKTIPGINKGKDNKNRQ
jgi:hypothetical protein